MLGKDGKIQTLEKDIDTMRNEVKTSQENQVGGNKKLRLFFRKILFRKKYKMN